MKNELNQNENERETLSIEDCEVWKTLQENENYQVSNLGRIKSNSRWIWTGRNNATLKWIDEKIFDWKPNGRGYKRVNIITPNATKKNKQQNFTIHILVAKYFLTNTDPENYTQINHIDGNKLNNVIWNLEYCTPKQNSQHYHNIIKPSLKKKLNEVND